MSKTKNTGSSKADAGQKQKLSIAAAVIIISVVIGFIFTGGGPPKDMPKALGGESRKTLSPQYFLGKTAKAYKAAKEIPDILDGIYCYCDCQKNFGHKSLLTCFVDKHGAQCGICMNEAVMAYDLHKKGHKTEDIIERVETYAASTIKSKKGGG